jgi:hypothetical protein
MPATTSTWSCVPSIERASRLSFARSQASRHGSRRVLAEDVQQAGSGTRSRILVSSPGVKSSSQHATTSSVTSSKRGAPSPIARENDAMRDIASERDRNLRRHLVGRPPPSKQTNPPGGALPGVALLRRTAARALRRCARCHSATRDNWPPSRSSHRRPRSPLDDIVVSTGPLTSTRRATAPLTSRRIVVSTGPLTSTRRATSAAASRRVVVSNWPRSSSSLPRPVRQRSPRPRIVRHACVPTLPRASGRQPTSARMRVAASAPFPSARRRGKPIDRAPCQPAIRAPPAISPP